MLPSLAKIVDKQREESPVNPEKSLCTFIFFSNNLPFSSLWKLPHCSIWIIFASEKRFVRERKATEQYIWNLLHWAWISCNSYHVFFLCPSEPLNFQFLLGQLGRFVMLVENHFFLGRTEKVCCFTIVKAKKKNDYYKAKSSKTIRTKVTTN